MPTSTQSHQSTEQILRLSAASHGVLSRRTLLSAGFRPRFIDGRIVAGWLLPVCEGVYAVGQPATTREAILMAALLAAGPGAVLAGRSAAEIWGFLRLDGAIETFRPESRKPNSFCLSKPGLRRTRTVRVKRCRSLSPGDTSVVRGLRVTSVELTLLDLATTLPRWKYRSAFNEADRMGLLRTDALLEWTGRGRGRKGIGQYRDLVEIRHPETVSTESELETMFFSLCRDSGLPDPEANRMVCGYRVDCLWPERRLVVELDGFEFHRGRMAFEKDTARDNTLILNGFQVLRFTHDMVKNRSAEVARLLRRTLDARHLQPEDPEKR